MSLQVKTFAEYIEQQLLMTRHLLYQFKFVPGGERALKECLRKNQKIHTTSDGSLNKERQHSSFGWLLIANKCVLVEGAGPVDGVPDLLSSTRAKLFGFGAVIEFLYHFCVFHNIQDCTSTLVTHIDNCSAISRVKRTQRKNAKRRCMCNDADVLSIIMNLLNKLLLQLCLAWVKPHQDKKKPYKEVDIAGCMNCDADALATSF